VLIATINSRSQRSKHENHLVITIDDRPKCQIVRFLQDSIGQYSCGLSYSNLGEVGRPEVSGARVVAVNLNELATMDATAEAEPVRRRELTPLELVNAAIARIKRLNPKLAAAGLWRRETPSGDSVAVGSGIRTLGTARKAASSGRLASIASCAPIAAIRRPHRIVIKRAPGGRIHLQQLLKRGALKIG
jgi:hypothetical protein